AGGTLELVFRLTDEAGNSRSLSASVASPLAGTRFGIAARHRASEAAAWDFHDLGATEPWKVDYVARSAPFAYEFGSGPERDSAEDLLPAHPRPEAWSLTADSLRFARNIGPWETSGSAIWVRNYHRGQVSAVEAGRGGGRW